MVTVPQRTVRLSPALFSYPTWFASFLSGGFLCRKSFLRWAFAVLSVFLEWVEDSIPAGVEPVGCATSGFHELVKLMACYRALGSHNASARAV